MVRLHKIGNEWHLVFSSEEVQRLRLSAQTTVELAATSKGAVVLLDSGFAVPKSSFGKDVFSGVSTPALAPSVFNPPGVHPLDQKLFARLRDKTQLGKCVVGVFEKTLSHDELKRLEELKKRKIIEPFKLSSKYKNAIYRIRPGVLSSKQASSVLQKNLKDQKNPVDYSLEKNGFLAVATDVRAKQISSKLETRIKRGEVRGIKAFDGVFYIMENDLYQSLQLKALSFFRQHSLATVAELALALQSGVTVAKIVCEFLKEDGFVFEKRKGIFKAID